MMAEQAAYYITFSYGDKCVFEAQQRTARGCFDQSGQPLPLRNNPFAKLILNKNWAAVSPGHRHEPDRIVTQFSFTSLTLPVDVDPLRVLESAVFDMRTWVREVGLDDSVLPITVELRKYLASEGLGSHQDFTQEAIAIMGQIATLSSVEPENFQ